MSFQRKQQLSEVFDSEEVYNSESNLKLLLFNITIKLNEVFLLQERHLCNILTKQTFKENR